MPLPNLPPRNPNNSNPNCQNPNYHHNNPTQRISPTRMGILVQNSPNYELIHYISRRSVVGGVFCVRFTPPIHLVRQIVEVQWDTRGPIHITRTGCYFIFECMHHRDWEVLLLQNTTVMDGKLIIFRPTSEYQVPSNISFNMARIWVRMHYLP